MPEHVLAHPSQNLIFFGKVGLQTPTQFPQNWGYPMHAALDPETQTTRMGFRPHSGGCTRVVKGANRGRHPHSCPSPALR